VVGEAVPASVDPWTVASSDGAEIAVHPLAEGDEPVVLVHGTACDHRVWARAARRLPDRFAVHAVDRRGRGASGDGPEHALEREVEDLVAACERVAERDGTAPHLVGHSLGALVAVDAAAEAPVARVAAYEPPVGGGAGPDPSEVAGLEDLLEAEGPEAVAEAFLSRVGYGPEELERLKRLEPVWASTVGAAHTIPRETRALAGYEADAFRLAGVEAPVWLGVGGDSPPVYRDAAARLTGWLPDARVEVLECAGHSAHVEAPDAFVEGLVGFLDEGS